MLSELGALLGIVCCCVPNLVPLFKKIRQKLFTNSRGSLLFVRDRSGTQKIRSEAYTSAERRAKGLECWIMHRHRDPRLKVMDDPEHIETPNVERDESMKGGDNRILFPERIRCGSVTIGEQTCE